MEGRQTEVATRPREVTGGGEGGIEIRARFDEFGTEGAHGAVFVRLLPWGTTMVAAWPCRAAAQAMLWPWLPRVAATTPRGLGSDPVGPAASSRPGS